MLHLKKSLYAQERDREDVKKSRDNFIEFMPEINSKKLFVMDESGFPLNMTNPYARGKKGERVKMPAPMHGKNISAIGVIGLNAVVDVALIEGSVDQACIEAFITSSLLPKLGLGDILLIDNAPVHHMEKINKLLETVGALALPLPKYSPDLSPIEMMWSKIKENIKRMNPRTRGELYESFVYALDEIDSDDLKGWYEHCGFDVAA